MRRMGELVMGGDGPWSAVVLTDQDSVLPALWRAGVPCMGNSHAVT